MNRPGNEIFVRNLDLATMQEGTSVPQINKGDLALLEIPVPPQAEQRRIVGELDALLPAILDRAFKGEL